MKYIMPDAMLATTHLTRAGRLTEASTALQRLLSGQVIIGGAGAPDSTDAQARRRPPTMGAWSRRWDRGKTGRHRRLRRDLPAAVAQSYHTPLLFQEADFAQTDIRAVSVGE